RPVHRVEPGRPRRRPHGPRMTSRLTQQGALLLGAALVAWIVTVERMSGMDMGPGTDLGGLGWFVGIWVTMMAAMMLPSVAPMVLLFDRVAAEQAKRDRPVVPTWIFVSTYLGVWAVYGLGAYCVGCCWGLMVILFALGVMSLFWMGVVAALIFAQKVLPYGDRLTRAFALLFVAAGIWLAAAPSTFPGLTEPGKMPNQMRT